MQRKTMVSKSEILGKSSVLTPLWGARRIHNTDFGGRAT